MSVVYSVVMYTGFGQPKSDIFPTHNDPEDEWDDQVLKEVSEYSGGHKYPGNVFLGGVNYLQKELFLKIVQDTEWEWPEDIVVMIDDETENRPEVWRFKGKELVQVV